MTRKEADAVVCEHLTETLVGLFEVKHPADRHVTRRYVQVLKKIDELQGGTDDDDSQYHG